MAATDPVTPSRMFAMKCLDGNLPESAAIHNRPDRRCRAVECGQMPRQRNLRCRVDFPQARKQGPGRSRVAQLMQIAEEYRASQRRIAEHEMHPRPRLLVLCPSHLLDLVEPLE